MKKNLKEEVIELIADTLEMDKEQIKETTNLARDLEVESLDLVDLVVAFEEKYNIEIPDQEVKNLQTVSDIISFIENHA